MTLYDWTVDLYERHGHLTPEMVREAARPETSPAHSWVFNVGPHEAAEGYYLERAHLLIRSVRVKHEVRDAEEPVRIRVWHHVQRDDGKQVYESYQRLQERPDLLTQARDRAVARLKQAEDAVEELDALAQSRPDSGPASGRALKQVRTARRTLERAAVPSPATA